MNKTSIEWTRRPGTVGMTWNPIHFKRDDGGSSKTGNMCTRISPGCTHCYASTLNERWGNRLDYTVENLGKGYFYLDEKELQAPLRAKKPCTIFVGDMFDLFHEAIPEEFVGHVFAQMALAKQHTFQLLTKRADEMLDLLKHADSRYGPLDEWPLPNVWCGVSVESQKYADERIPLLLQTPAAVRFLSVEPQLEAVTMDGVGKSNGWWITCPKCGGDCSAPSEHGGGKPCPKCFGLDGLHHQGQIAGIDWVICGGESGFRARPFNLAWAESLREQCKAAGVAFFMKQVGSNPAPLRIDNGSVKERLWLKSSKGGDPSEWPESLRVREFPG